MTKPIVLSSFLFGAIAASALSFAACSDDTSSDGAGGAGGSAGARAVGGAAGAPSGGGNNGAGPVDTSTLTITEIVNSKSELSSLKAAFAKDKGNYPEGSVSTALEDTSGIFSYTLFAPTNEALNKVVANDQGKAAKCVSALLNDKIVLQALLQYHGIKETFEPSSLESGAFMSYETFTENMDLIKITNNASTIEIDERAKAKIVSTYKAKNGTVHTVDKVLIPPSPALPADCLLPFRLSITTPVESIRRSEHHGILCETDRLFCKHVSGANPWRDPLFFLLSCLVSSVHSPPAWGPAVKIRRHRLVRRRKGHQQQEARVAPVATRLIRPP